MTPLMYIVSETEDTVRAGTTEDSDESHETLGKMTEHVQYEFYHFSDSSMILTGTDEIAHSVHGNRVISLSRLGEYIRTITCHSATCLAELVFLGEASRNGLASRLVSRCMLLVYDDISVYDI